MTGAPAHMLAVFCALRREAAPFRRLITEEATESVSGFALATGRARGASPVVTVQSGVGRERASAAARLVLERLPLGAIMCTGFAGAADPSLSAGDIVVGDRVTRLAPGGGPTGEVVASNGRWAQAMTEALKAKGLETRAGLMATAPEVLGPEAKHRAGALGALAVDMESYWVALAATDAGVPFLAVRAISDEVGDTLPPFQRFTDGLGNVRPRAALTYFAAHPGQWRPAARLAGRVQHAVRSLALIADVLFSEAGAAPAGSSHGRAATR